MTQQTVLLVDDEPDILQLLEITLARMNLETQRAETLAQAQRALTTSSIDLCLTDMRLPDGNGLSLIEHIQQHYPHIPVAMITAHGSVESAIEALKLGAFDFVSKPLALDKLRGIVSHALRLQMTPPNTAPDELLGTTEPMCRLREQVEKVARSQAPVHIYGESGVGKEVVAKQIHRLSSRGQKPFIAVNCGAIPPELVESELFGHIKGAFTGASSDKSGLFQAASGGTLLLDEVADLPLNVQVRLLRAVQEKAVRPVGSDKEVATDVRLLSATHKNLAEEVAQGRFRDDLYYRLHVIAIEVPPLRARRGDISLLANHLLRQMADSQSQPPKTLSAEALERLCQYDFPGNVRELENILARANALSDHPELQAKDLSIDGVIDHASQVKGSSDPATLSDADQSRELLQAVDGDLEGYLESIERKILAEALQQQRWNKTATAAALGISFRSLRYRLKKLGLEDR